MNPFYTNKVIDKTGTVSGAGDFFNKSVWLSQSAVYICSSTTYVNSDRQCKTILQ